MPLIIALKDITDTADVFGSYYFLLKEDTLPAKALHVIKQKIETAQKFDNASKEDIIRITEDVLEEYNVTFVPYSLYVIRY